MSADDAVDTVRLPIAVHARNGVTGRARVPNLLHVRKVEWPEQDAYIALLDSLKARSGFKTDAALSELAGISHAAISNWRLGKVKPSYRLVAAIANAYDEDPDEHARIAGLLVGRAGDKPPAEQLPAEIETLARLHRESEGDRREALINQIRVVIDWFEATSSQRRRRAS